MQEGKDFPFILFLITNVEVVHVENLENSDNLKMENKIQPHVHHPEITMLAFCSMPLQPFYAPFNIFF